MKIMKKMPGKISNKVLVLWVIINLISSQFILPFSISRAQGSDGETAEVATEPTSSDSGTEAVEETKEAEPEAEVAPPEESTPKTEEVLPAAAETSLTVPEETELPVVQNNATENNNVCSCKDAADEINGGEGTCPTDCACCQPADCESDAVAVNVAEEVSNTTQAISETGENAIIGEIVPAPAENPIVNAEPNSGQSENANNDAGDENDNSKDNDENKATVEESQAGINTGNAVAGAVAVNHINTNIFTENGTEYVENITGDFTGDINLIDAFDGVLENAQNLNQENQKSFEKVTVTNVNVAQKVENTLVAEADSGENLIENIDGLAEIVTGSAEALASAINFVNTNIVGNNWLFAEINILGNWTGNLIVPGEGLFNLPSAGMVFDKISNTNLAKSVSNFLSSSANTGENSIESTAGDATILTGKASATSSGVNMVNTNIVRNNWFFLMINNAGNWTGQVFNWNNGNQSLAYEYNFGSLAGADSQVSKCVSVNNFNSAEEVQNTVVASADTGGNIIKKATGDATISTGNATARASAFNFINTNIVGNNWFLGIVNNAGNWDGDVIFGYPDLAVTLSADRSALEPGENLVYSLRYRNVGQAKCGNVDLMLSLPENFVYQSDSAGGAQKKDNDYFWSMAGLKPGEEKTFSVTVLLDPKTAENIVSLESVAGIRTDTEERNLSNNYESEKTNLIFITDSQVTIQDDASVFPEKQAKISIERSEAASVAVGSVSSHSISVKNTGKGSLFNLEVKEKIVNPSGEKMAEYVWPIAELKKGQSALIEYQISIDPSSMLGNYTHTASAKALDYYGREIESREVSQVVVFFRDAPKQTTLGASEENLSLLEEAEASENYLPGVIGMANEKKIAWQWLLLLLLIPIAYYARKERIYRWENIQKFSRQMGNFLSSFL